MKKFRYLLKLRDGKVKYGEGFNLEEAARDAKVSVSEVKRATPTMVVPTDEEKKRQAQIKREKRSRALKALKLARVAKAERAEKA